MLQSLIRHPLNWRSPLTRALKINYSSSLEHRCLLYLSSCPASEQATESLSGFPWGLIHELHKSYIYLPRPTKFTLSTVGHLLPLLPLVITSSTGSWSGPRCSEHTTHCFPASHEWWMEVTELFIQSYCTPLDCDIRWQGFCHCSFSNMMEWGHFQLSPGSPWSLSWRQRFIDNVRDHGKFQLLAYNLACALLK